MILKYFIAILKLIYQIKRKNQINDQINKNYPGI